MSTFLSPLATAYLLLVAILVAATWRRGPRWLPLLTVLAAIALLFTYSRTTIAALAVGLVALGYALRSWWPVAAAAVFVAAAFFFVRAYPDIAPETRYTAAELEIQREGGQEQPTSGGPRSRGVVVREPSGRARGRGRDGRPAPAGLRRRQRRRDREADGGGDQGRRVDATPSSGSSWGCSACSCSSPGTSRCSGSCSGASPGSRALAAVLALAIQTDVIGVHWLAFVLWTLAGERA